MPLALRRPVPDATVGDCRVYVGDCLQLLPRLPPADMVFADPPFNIGYEYDAYDDNKTYEEYMAWTNQWLMRCYMRLKPGGSIVVAIGIQLQAELKMAMDAVGFQWRNTIPWHYTFGPRQEGNFTPSWVALHYAVKPGADYTWNADAIRVPSARQLKYGDKRAKAGGKLPDNVWVLMPSEYEGCFQPHQNAMLESRVCGTFKERTGHPCQMPEAVLTRLIRVLTNPGDTVLDPFLGSGTTAATALRLGRKCMGIELSEAYVRDYVVPRLRDLAK